MHRTIAVALLLTLAAASQAWGYEPWEDANLKPSNWILGDTVTIKYALDTSHGTASVAGNAEWDAIRGVCQSMNNLAYRVNLHIRDVFPLGGGMFVTSDATEIRRFRLYNFQEVAPGSGEDILFGGWSGSLPADTVGLTTSRVIQFNNNLPWMTGLAEGASSSTFDVATVAMHELDHALGLGHPNPLHPEAVMYQGYGFRGDTTLETDDLNGLAYLYGPKPGVDYATMFDGLTSGDEAWAKFHWFVDRSAMDPGGYNNLYMGLQLPALRSGYFTRSNGVQESFDLSWSLPSYGPQLGGVDAGLSAAELDLARQLWTGQITYAAEVAPLPEPATLTLLAFGAFGILRRRAA